VVPFPENTLIQYIYIGYKGGTIAGAMRNRRNQRRRDRNIIGSVDDADNPYTFVEGWILKSVAAARLRVLHGHQD
jgi:hypothetical protein